MALSIAIKEAADKILNEEFAKTVYDSALTNAAADRVSLDLSEKNIHGVKKKRMQRM